MMKNPLKVLFAYDGSESAEIAIRDLERAGLPPQGEARIVSAADISKVSIANFFEPGISGRYVPLHVLEKTFSVAQEESSQTLNEAEELAFQGSEQFLSILPNWRVVVQTVVGNPAEELLRAATEWKPDLIIVGSHKRGAIGRFFLGSVSQKIAEQAHCSVRVAHCSTMRKAAPNRILIGADTLPDAERLIETIGSRVWSEKTEVKLIKADDGVSSGRVSAMYPYAPAILEQAMEKLGVAGLEVSVGIRSGKLKDVLLEESINWNPDSIFVLAGSEPTLSEAAMEMITEAACTVEVVR